ncbi:diguanylate cyclase domain-containing protein [Aquaspirillum serpens]|uniref:diguanylate cyclase domain-containing protein n=1 Tax=Aquaspirillum serpens TaxID=190 RepID=UPI000411D77F|nr:diguanylate cyclase [Aquaspirillum serpens]
MVQALNAAQDPILIADQKAKIVFVNSAFEKLTGYQSTEILGKTPRLLQSGNHDPIFYRDLWKKLSQGQGFRATFMNRRKNGQVFYAEQSIAPLKDKQGNITHFVSVAKDISDIVEREKTLSELAHHDQLTGLLNRHAGERLLHNQLEQLTQDQDGCFCLIVCDIDFFKQINDQHGHITGDRVIQDVAHTMNQLARQTDAVIRWGGDEFVLIVDAPLPVALKLAERVRSTVNLIPDYQIGKLSMSFGIAEAKTGETMTDLFARADAALYQAKQKGRNCVVSA